MLFYMDTRYEGENGEPELELVDAVNTFDMNSPGKGYHGKLSTLLQWNKADPVDKFEVNRNNVVYKYQKNRNPFIDHPEYVGAIWNTTGMDNHQQLEIRIYPNPASDYIIIEGVASEIVQGKIYSITGETVLNFEITGNYKLSTSGITSGLYFLHVECGDKIHKSKLIILK